MNQVILIGRLTADPELKFINTGTAISKFTLAIDRTYTKNGASVTDFIPIEIWGKKAEYCAEAEADGKCSVLFFGIIAAEALRERAGRKAHDLHGSFTDLHGFNARALTGAEAQQLPAIAACRKNGGQQYRCGQQRCDCFLAVFHGFLLLFIAARGNGDSW